MNAHEQTRRVIQFHVERGARTSSDLSLSERRLLAGAYYNALLESDPGYAYELIAEHLSPAHLSRMGGYLMQSSRDIVEAQRAARFLAEELADTVVEHLRADLDKMISDEVGRRAESAYINRPSHLTPGAADLYWMSREL